ncbi:transposase-like protein [Corynebacterium diphtheriae]|nr:transposase-like protein [Corynebacterium diphtheriae]
MLWATDDDYMALEVTWLLYQDMITAYAHPKKTEGKKLMERIIHTLRKGLPKSLEKLAQLGRTLWRRRKDVLAYFDIGASNGPVAAINGRLEHLRGIALGFKKPQPLHLAVPNPLRTTTRQNQRTLKPEEPLKCSSAS